MVSEIHRRGVVCLEQKWAAVVEDVPVLGWGESPKLMMTHESFRSRSRCYSRCCSRSRLMDRVLESRILEARPWVVFFGDDDSCGRGRCVSLRPLLFLVAREEILSLLVDPRKEADILVGNTVSNCSRCREPTA